MWLSTHNAACVFQTFVNWTAKNFLKKKKMSRNISNVSLLAFSCFSIFRKSQTFLFRNSFESFVRTSNSEHRTHFAFLHFEIIFVCVIQWMKTFSRNFTFQCCVCGCVCVTWEFMGIEVPFYSHWKGFNNELKKRK